MDKEFVLKYLKLEHLQSNPEMLEIAEVKGLEFAKELLKDFESMRFLYVPTLERNRGLMRDVIADNYKRMTVQQLARKTGLTVRKVKEIIRELEEKK